MKQIQLQFSTCNGIGSAIIRWHCCSKFSHVDLVTEAGALMGARMDGGVLVRPPRYARFTDVEIVTLPVTDEQYEKFWAFAKAQLGKPYDKTAILGLVAHRNWRDDSKWFCSEYAATALETAGILAIDTEANWISPEALRLIVLQHAGASKQDELAATAAGN